MRAILLSVLILAGVLPSVRAAGLDNWHITPAMRGYVARGRGATTETLTVMLAVVDDKGTTLTAEAATDAQGTFLIEMGDLPQLATVYTVYLTVQDAKGKVQRLPSERLATVSVLTTLADPNAMAPFLAHLEEVLNTGGAAFKAKAMAAVLDAAELVAGDLVARSVQKVQIEADRQVQDLGRAVIADKPGKVGNPPPPSISPIETQPILGESAAVRPAPR